MVAAAGREPGREPGAAPDRGAARTGGTAPTAAGAAASGTAAGGPAPGPAGRRERGKADKRARILAAARRRLAEQGYGRMTVAQVAADADVAVGTVFQYAATKAELLMMVAADRWSGAIPAAVAAADAGRGHGDPAGAAAGRAAADAAAGEPGAPAGDPVDAVLGLLAPLLAASRDEPGTTAAVARELLFGAPGPHREAVVSLVADLEAAVAAVLRAAGAGRRAQSASRLVVSGGLLEVNRTRTGRAPADSAEDRLRALVEIAVDGARAG